MFPAGVAVLLSMAATLLLTGAFHEDGLADCVDAFGGAYTRDDALRIMHDSRIGAFGAIALVVALALKWQTLAALPPMRAAWLMIAAHAASRTCAISYLVTLDYVRAEGKAKPVAQRMSGAALRCAAMFGLPWLFWPDGQGAPDWRFAGVAVLIVLRFLMGRYFVATHWRLYRRLPRLRATDFRTGIYLIGLAWISS